MAADVEFDLLLFTVEVDVASGHILGLVLTMKGLPDVFADLPGVDIADDPNVLVEVELALTLEDLNDPTIEVATP